MIRIKVPATTANIGPGFDTLGIALNLFNIVEVSKHTGLEKTVLWANDQKKVPDEDNLVLQTMNFVLRRYNRMDIGFTITMTDCQIPVSRGLGSSAATIVLGIYAANYILDFKLSLQDIIHLASELEGHPDNVVPAILGNMIISCVEKDSKQVYYSTIDFPDELLFKVLIPDFTLSTKDARLALPSTYSREQCVNNISHVCLLINALITRNYELLKFSLKDDIHEPYRLKLIQESEIIISKLNSMHTFGAFISGGGPTLIAMVNSENIEFDADLIPFLNTLQNTWALKSITVNKSGTTYEIIE